MFITGLEPTTSRLMCQLTYRETTMSPSCHIYFQFEEPVGTFLNGILYWKPCGMDMLMVLNVKDMTVSDIHLPFLRSYHSTRLGTIYGRLRLLCNSINETCFDLWEKEFNKSWSKTNSFSFYHISFGISPICFLDHGRILLMTTNKQFIMYYVFRNCFTRFDRFFKAS